MLFRLDASEVFRVTSETARLSGPSKSFSGAQHVITLGGLSLKEVESFKYLGSSFTATGQAKDEISGRIGFARSAFTRLKATMVQQGNIAQDGRPHL